MLPASMLGDNSMSASLIPSCFFIVSTCWVICFPSHRYSTYFFLLFWIIIPAILYAMMLGYYSISASSMPSSFFIVVSIYWKPTSYSSSLDLLSFGKTTNRSATKLICSFFSFGPTCMLFDLSIALRLRQDLSKVATPTPRFGACETWVPLGLH
jgi:hypothetical protein